MSYVTHEGKSIAAPEGQKVKSAWDAWLEQQGQKGAAGLPACIQAMHRQHGIDRLHTCKGCLSLTTIVEKTIIKMINGPMQKRTTHHQCTSSGTTQEWDPSWAACGRRSEPEPKKKTRRPRGRAAA